MINSICNEFFTPDGPTINPQYYGQQQQKPLSWDRVNELWLLACNDRTKLPTHVVFARLIESNHKI